VIGLLVRYAKTDTPLHILGLPRHALSPSTVSVRVLLNRSVRWARRIHQTWVYLCDRYTTPKEHVNLSARTEQAAPLRTRERTGYMSRKTVLLFPSRFHTPLLV